MPDDLSETNGEEYFGTPEAAFSILDENCRIHHQRREYVPQGTV
ncbi:hypothetical protein [Halovenus salina]|uniref:Uncharacterized protein n=1 Tax=Halovenus salina TaxID=1510225 RepID=A0ABD5W462_9EURY|nr:hypothetical protein [Halovenus salina]